jgi:predicted TIM-barrel fold metal-dependent hydrolase
MMIDIFTHIMPPNYEKALFKKIPSDSMAIQNAKDYPTLSDLDARFRILDKYEGLVQVINLVSPPIQDLVGPANAIELSKMANDEMAELVHRYPDRFVGAAACLPLNDMDASLEEIDRSIKALGFKGIQIYTDIHGKPLDSPEFQPIFEKMAQYNLPILLHPRRARTVPDYPTESHSKYEAFLIFGWPYETTLAMTRLVHSGLFERFPDLKIITHHCGAMVSFFADRIASEIDIYGTREGFRYEGNVTLDYYRKFHADTAVSGSTPALMCGYDFFGADRLLFGTDMPFDNEHGNRSTGRTIRSVEVMDIPDIDKKKIFEDNAKRLFQLSF